MKKEEEFCNVRFVGELEAGLVNKLDTTIPCGDPKDPGQAVVEKASWKEVFGIRQCPLVVQAEGKSMIGMNIEPGDWVVVDRDRVPQKGDVVLATVDGEATLKCFYPGKNSVRLVPANDQFQTRVVGPQMQLRVEGVAVRIVKCMKMGEVMMPLQLDEELELMILAEEEETLRSPFCALMTEQEHAEENLAQLHELLEGCSPSRACRVLRVCHQRGWLKRMPLLREAQTEFPEVGFTSDWYRVKRMNITQEEEREVLRMMGLEP